MNILNREQVMEKFLALNAKRQYKAMYSSLYGGIVTDASLMLIPIDDHMVHRGDGVFEAIRFTGKKIYLLNEHLERLGRSADRISLKLPMNAAGIVKVCEDLREVSGLQQGLLRLFIGRGPGDFSPNPYSTIGSQLYVVVTNFNPMPPEKYEKGATVMISKVPIKPEWYAQVKSCNYLPNVMMKKDSVDRGFDFAVNATADEFLAEGPTENIMIVNACGELVAPKFDYTLRGTTLVRTLELAKSLKKGLVSDIRVDDVSLADLRTAREIMMVGTTLSVLPVTKLEAAAVGNGSVGPVARELNQLVLSDMR